MTPEQAAIIKSTVPVLVQHGETITRAFYRNLLQDHSALKNVFNNVHQQTGHQQRALAGALYAYANNIDNLSALAPVIELIAHKHASLYVQPEHYSLVGEYLLAAMQEVLGSALTPEIASAWEAAYWELAHVFIAREKELYAAAKDWLDWKPFRIARKVKETESVTSFYLEPVDAPRCPVTGRAAALPLFKPGQYISMRLPVPALGGVLQSRQYSLSDAPGKPYYRISVKREPGAAAAAANAAANGGMELNAGTVSNLLHDTKSEGDEVLLSHPYGDFFLEAREDEAVDAPVVLLGAGVGLTCLTSILLDLANKQSTRPVVFAHGSRSAAERPFADELRRLAAEKENVSAVFFDKEGTDKDGASRAGRLAVERLDREEELHVHDGRTQYFVCGPAAFMKETDAKLREMGVAPERIHLELFSTGGVDRC